MYHIYQPGSVTHFALHIIQLLHFYRYRLLFENVI